MRIKGVVLSGLVLAAGVLPLAAGSSRAAPPTLTQGCLQSVPEPGSSAPVDICYTIYRPAAASARDRVPMVMHSHGWAGSRTNSPDAFAKWMDAGFGILSFDQRGFGQSGGQAHVQHPDLEGQDVIRLIDLIARLDWVQRDRAGDPRLGAIGGSYGGGYQFAGAFTELRDKGRTRFDALAPDKTWWDVKESLAPSEVPRTGWNLALYAAGARDVPQEIHQGFAYSAATGNWPKGQDPVASNLDAFFQKNGPAWHVSQGRRLDIPALVYQGITDNLFNLNQGISNFERALTPRARARSFFVGYNGGHALPSALPAGTQASGDPCSKLVLGADPKAGGGSGSAGVGSAAGYEDVAVRFMTEHLLGRRTGLASNNGRYHLATNDGACIVTRSVATDRVTGLADIQTPSGLSAPMFVPVADGPVTAAGVPRLEATVSTLGLGTRVFFALAVGTNAADARIVQNNMMPLHEPVAITAQRRSIELPGVAVEVPQGKKLFLAISGFSDMSFGHIARTPGLVTLEQPVLHLNTRL